MNCKEYKDLEYYRKNPYAWPGGYQLNAVMADGEYMCHECICNEDQVFQDDSKVDTDEWRFIAADIHYEGPSLYCAHCNKELKSEYGDPWEDEEEEKNNKYE